MKRQEAKEAALSILKNNWGGAIVFFLVYALIVSVLSGTGLGALLLDSVLLIGVYSVIIDASQTKMYSIERIFDGFKEGLTNRVILSFMKSLFIILWSLLFIIPGIVKSYSYMLAEFVSKEHPEYDYTECLEESKEKMEGHKMEMFVLELSFIGWALLSILTLGIGLLWLVPYMQQTKVEYINANIMKLRTDSSTKVEANFVDPE